MAKTAGRVGILGGEGAAVSVELLAEHEDTEHAVEGEQRGVQGAGAILPALGSVDLGLGELDILTG